MGIQKPGENQSGPFFFVDTSKNTIYSDVSVFFYHNPHELQLYPP